MELDCIPIDRDATGIGGMKITLKRLKKGESVVLFPEGERSWEGELLPLMTGFTALVKRVKVPIIPIGIHGTYEAWPRGAGKPKMHPVKVVVGEQFHFLIWKYERTRNGQFRWRKIALAYEEAKAWNT